MIEAVHLRKVYHTRTGPNQVLEDVNFQIGRGEKVGVLGRNGAGKSTFIRLLSGIEEPTGGLVRRDMSLSWPLAFGGAFQMSLTGLDNLRCICRIYGVRAEDKVEAVQEFSELGRYLYEPVRLYSSGMRARLAFALSMAIEFDCFLIDEIAAVGDERFQRKSNEELFVKRADRAMIIVSHSPLYIRQHCDRAAVMHNGRLHDFPDIEQAYKYYREIGSMSDALAEENAF